MSRLLLLRHAKTEWARPGERDFDRALRERGRRDSHRIGEELGRLDILPDQILCSPARRAAETLEHLLSALPPGQYGRQMEDELYGTDAAGYLRIVTMARPADCLMLIGHNPMMEDLALELAGSGDGDALARMERGFPTCGLAILSFAGPLTEIGPGRGRLEHFLTPRSLDRGTSGTSEGPDPWHD